MPPSFVFWLGSPVTFLSSEIGHFDFWKLFFLNFYRVIKRKKSRKQTIVWEELPPKKTRKKVTSEPRNNEELQSEIPSTESMNTGVKKIIYIDGIRSKLFKNTKSSKCRLIFKFISLLIVNMYLR